MVLPVATTASVTPPPGTDSTGCQDGVAADAAWAPDSMAAATAPPVPRTMETRKSFCLITLIAPIFSAYNATHGYQTGRRAKRLLPSEIFIFILAGGIFR